MVKEVLFTTADDCLNNEQKQAITALYARTKTTPSVMPVIPKKDVRGRKLTNSERTVLAGQAIMNQALNLFPGKECDRILKMRTNCDRAIWNRVNYHWRHAAGEWITSSVNSWKTKEHIPLR